MTLGTRVQRLEDKVPPVVMPPERLRGRIRELMAKSGIDPAEIATPDKFDALCKSELTRLRGRKRGL